MLLADFLFLLLPVAAASGWYAGYRHSHDNIAKYDSSQVNKDYFLGLNYLLNDQPDKAVDYFIKMLEVNADTIETHLALGTLFRRRGEVDRAIRVHQNVIARPNLAKEHRVHALSELGMDYLRAGLLDRAEKLFLELLSMHEESESSCNYLLNIYQLQKDWQAAASTAEKLLAFDKSDGLKVKLSQYYCELAELAEKEQNFKLVKEYINKALRYDKNCVRANLLLGMIAEKEGKFKNAIQYYMEIKKQNSDYLSEIVAPLQRCYVAMNNLPSLVELLEGYLREKPNTLVVLAIAGILQDIDGKERAMKFLLHVLEKFPSLAGIDQLLQFYSKPANGQTGEIGGAEEFTILQKFMAELVARKPNYRCARCGFSSKVMYWQCPGCKQWTTMKWVD